MLTRFLKARVVKNATSLTEVPFEARENQLEDDDLECGMKAREVLNQCQSTCANTEDQEH